LGDNAFDLAPADDYAPSVECLLPLQTKAYETKKAVYLKTKTDDEATPYKYSRLELNMTVGKAKLIVDMTAVTNPDGSVNLKEDTIARQQYIAQCISEINASMKNDTVNDEQLKGEN